MHWDPGYGAREPGLRCWIWVWSAKRPYCRVLLAKIFLTRKLNQHGRLSEEYHPSLGSQGNDVSIRRGTLQATQHFPFEPSSAADSAKITPRRVDPAVGEVQSLDLSWNSSWGRSRLEVVVQPAVSDPRPLPRSSISLPLPLHRPSCPCLCEAVRPTRQS